jgi:uncharacterized repeat protein (TIGR01451 family)
MRTYTPVLGRVCSFFTLVVFMLIALTPGGAAAIEVPPATIGTYLQTNGPTSPIGQGDWYTSNGNGAVVGYHYYEITIPRNWPTTAPVYVDLFSPEMVVDSVSDEIRPGPPNVLANANKTTFELYGPGTAITLPNQPGPGATGTIKAFTYNPVATGNAETWRRFATLPAPVTPGTYVLRAETQGDDENAWRVQVGTDNDNDPTNTPPTNYDNPDGVVGTDDEILIGVRTGSYQNNAAAGAVDCLTLYEYVAPGQTSVAFQNFDIDISLYPLSHIRYYAPADAYDPTGLIGGTVGVSSDSSAWNGVATLSRGNGDVITNPATGWWKIVTCAEGNNQYIQEGQTPSTAYFVQPPTPAMTVAKSDGLTVVAPGDKLTYTINYVNTSSGSTAGSANQVVIKDTIPTNTTYVSCSIPAADGTCSQAGGVVTYTLSHHVTPGATGSVQVTVQVNAGVANGNTVANNVTLDYKDSLGNAYLQQSASDTDTVQIAPALPTMTVSKTDGLTVTTPGNNLTYTITYTNTSVSVASNVVLKDTLPTNTSYVPNSCVFVLPATGTCSQAGGVVTFNLAGNVVAGASGQVQVTVTVNTGLASGDSVINNVTLDYQDTLSRLRPQQSASDMDTVQLIPVMTVTKTDGKLLTAPNESLTYTITYTNTASGPSAGPAANVVLQDTLPTNTTYGSCALVAPTTGTCSQAGGVITFAPTGNVAPGASGQVQVTVTVNAGVASGDLVVNNVTLTYKDTAGSAKTPVSVSDMDTVQSPVMTVTKTDGKLLTAPNESLTYTITYTNTASGPSAGPAANVVLQDTLPTNTSYGGCVFVAPTMGTCSQAGGVITFAPTGNVAPGASGQVQVTVTVNTGVASGDTVVNNVTLNYKDTAGNAKTQVSASDIDTVQSPVMTVTKTDGKLLTAPNENLTYTITYTNTASGPSAGPAATVVLQDTLPTNTSYGGCVFVAPTTGTCSQAGGVITFAPAGNVAPGASGQVQVTVTVNAGVASGDSVVNNVTLTYKDTAGNAKTPVSVSDMDTVQSPVMTVTKTDGKTLTATGNSLTYTITYTNTASGPSAGSAVTVVLQDTLPTNTTYVSCSIPVADGSCSQAGGVVTYTLSHTVVPGASGQVQTTVTVNTGTSSTVVNTVTLNYKDSAGNTKTPVSDSDMDQIVGPDLRLTKDASSATIVAGQPITYTLTYLNSSAVTASGVVIAETVPVGTHFVAAGGTSGWSCPDNAAAGTACRLSLGTLVGNATGSVTFIVRVDKPFPTGLTQIDNTASISDDGTHGADPTPVNNVAATKKPPTAVTLTRFSADRQTKGVWLNWTTGSELNSLGFQIYRSSSGNRSDAVLVTPQLIVSRGAGASGASYSVLDPSADAGVSYHYWLIEQDIGGGSNEFGPVQITGLRSSPYQIFLPLVLR